MGMLKTVLQNLFARTRTRAPTDMPPPPTTFRGALAHDPSLCTGCGTCAFVCAPKAISFASDPGKSVSWLYYIGQCSFCGLCAQNCPTQAISNTGAVPATSNDADGNGLRIESIVHLIACPRCGAVHIPLPEATMTKLLAGGLTGTAQAEKDYCPECRQWATSNRMREAFVAKTTAAAANKTEGAA